MNKTALIRLLLFVGIVAAPPLHAQALNALGVPSEGEGSLNLGLETVVINERTRPGGGTEDFGEITRRYDYPLFTETQAGMGLWNFDLGLNVGGRFPGPLQSFYWQAGYVYSIVERTSINGYPDRRVNHDNLSLQLGWIANSDWTVRVAATRTKTYGGLTFTDDFTAPYTDDLFYNHDRLFEWEYTTVDLGVGRRIGWRYFLYASIGKTVDLEWGHRYERVLNLGLSRSF